MEKLQVFYAQQEMYNTVKEYFFDHLKDITIKKAFAGEPTDGIYEAKNALQNAFKQIEDTWGVKPENKVINISE